MPAKDYTGKDPIKECNGWLFVYRPRNAIPAVKESQLLAFPVELLSKPIDRLEMEILIVGPYHIIIDSIDYDIPMQNKDTTTDKYNNVRVNIVHCTITPFSLT